MHVDRVFGTILKEIRNQKGISQSELANRSDLDRTYISLLERGLRQPTLETLFKLADALNIKPSFIIQKMESENEN